MSFSGRHNEVVYILVPIKIHVSKDMGSGHYICDELDYNTGKWWRFDYYTITNYSRYPDNVYDYLSHENEQKKR